MRGHGFKQALETDDPVDPAFFINHRQGSQSILGEEVGDVTLLVVKSCSNHPLGHDGLERRLGIARQQFTQVDGSNELTLVIFHVDIVDDIEVTRFTPQRLKGLLYGRMRRLREKTGGHHTAGRLLVVGEEASDILCRFRLHFLKETLGMGFFQFLEEVRSLTGRHLLEHVRGFLGGHLLDQLDLDLGIRLFEDLGSHFDVKGTENPIPLRPVEVFNDVGNDAPDLREGAKIDYRLNIRQSE